MFKGSRRDDPPLSWRYTSTTVLYLYSCPIRTQRTVIVSKAVRNLGSTRRYRAAKRFSSEDTKILGTATSRVLAWTGSSTARRQQQQQRQRVADHIV